MTGEEASVCVCVTAGDENKRVVPDVIVTHLDADTLFFCSV